MKGEVDRQMTWFHEYGSAVPIQLIVPDLPVKLLRLVQMTYLP